MNKEKRLTQERKNAYAPFIFLVVLELLFHALLLTRLSVGDDYGYAHRLDTMSLFEFVRNDFMTWCSRFIINGGIAVIDRWHPWFWRIMDVGIIGLFAWSAAKITETDHKKLSNIVLVCLFLMYPFTHQGTAGWVTTTITYLWPTVIGIYAGVLLKKTVAGETIKTYEYVLGALAAVFACNLEQNSVVIFVVAGVVLLYQLYRREKTAVPAMIVAIAGIELLIHLICPGADVREAVAVKQLDVDFYMLSLVEKLQLGFAETTSKLFFAPNLIFAFLLSAVAVSVLSKRKDACARIVVLVPLICCLSVGFLPDLLKGVFPESQMLAHVSAFNFFTGCPAYGGLVSIYNFQLRSAYFPLFLLAVCTLFTAIGIYLSIESLPKSLMTVLIYLLGVAGGMVMGFSPTLYASSLRTYTIVYFCMMIAAMFVVNNNWEHLLRLRYKKAALYLLYTAAACNFLDVAIQAAKILEQIG